MKVKDLDSVRGSIVTRFVTIDTALNMIIARHYLGDSPDNKRWTDFLFNVLENEQCTFAFRRNIFIHILRSDNVDSSNVEELNRLNKIRNVFAHKQHISGDVTQTPESDVYYTNPKFPQDKSKNIPADDYIKEFDQLYPDVMNWLFAMCKKKGILLS
jgi:hypothetical protein